MAIFYVTFGPFSVTSCYLSPLNMWCRKCSLLPVLISVKKLGRVQRGLRVNRIPAKSLSAYDDEWSVQKVLTDPEGPGLILKRSCFFFSVDLLCLSFSSSSKSRPKYVSKSTWFLNHLSSSSNCLWMCEKSWIRAFYGSIWSNSHFRYISEPEVVSELGVKKGLITSGLIVDTGSDCEEGFRINVGVPLV